MLLVELRTLVARYAHKLADSGLVRATQGNISARQADRHTLYYPPETVDILHQHWLESYHQAAHNRE